MPWSTWNGGWRPWNRQVSEPTVHQILVGAGPTDAITSMARRLQLGLRTRYRSDIYAHFLPPDMAGEIRALADLEPAGHHDLLVYHASYGEPIITKALLERTERMVVVYHNITPPVHYQDQDPAFAMGLMWGRQELAILRDRVVLAVAVSSFNAQDLALQGYPDVHVIPAGLVPSRLCEVASCGELATQLRDWFPEGYVLAVSQLLPHKRFEVVLQAMHLVQWVHGRSIGVAIVGPPRSPAYATALKVHASRLGLGRVWFSGATTDAELATLFRLATTFVSASVHEGLALPPLEAMSFGVPVIAREAGAIAETLGGAALLLPASAGPMMLSEAIIATLDRDDVRAELRRRGHERVAAIEADDPVERFVQLVAQVA
jgi:glycosyltransferase involved in cell wall biosynthesis